MVMDMVMDMAMAMGMAMDILKMLRRRVGGSVYLKHSNKISNKLKIKIG